MRTITATDLARLASLTARAIRKAGAPGGPLARARMPRGGFDLDHEDVGAWLAERGINVPVAVPAVAAADIERKLGATATDPLDAIGSMTLDAITDRYGAEPQFLGWTRARKELAMARRAEAQLSKLHGQLIALERVQLLFEMLDVLTMRLIRHAAVSIERDLRGDFPRERRIAVVQERLLAQVAAAREHMQNVVRGIDPSAALREVRPRDRPDPAQLAAHKALSALREPLARNAAPSIVTMVAKAVGRAAHGKQWCAAVFDDALALAAGVHDECVRTAGTMLGAELDRAIRSVGRPPIQIRTTPIAPTRRKTKPQRSRRR